MNDIARTIAAGTANAAKATVGHTVGHANANAATDRTDAPNVPALAMDHVSYSYTKGRSCFEQYSIHGIRPCQKLFFYL